MWIVGRLLDRWLMPGVMEKAAGVSTADSIAGQCIANANANSSCEAESVYRTLLTGRDSGVLVVS
jgi:hypothetical protein